MYKSKTVRALMVFVLLVVQCSIAFAVSAEAAVRASIDAATRQVTIEGQAAAGVTQLTAKVTGPQSEIVNISQIAVGNDRSYRIEFALSEHAAEGGYKVYIGGNGINAAESASFTYIKAPEPSPGTPEPSPGTPEPSPGTPEPSPGTPEPSPGTPKPSPGTPTPSPGTPQPSTAAPTPSPSPSAPIPSPAAGVLVQGDVSETKDGTGQAATQITVGAEQLKQAAEALKKLGNGAAELIVEVPANHAVALVSVSAQALADAENAVTGALIVIKSGAAGYYFPADLIDAAALAKELGAEASDVQITITLEKKTGADADAIAAAVRSAGGEIVGDAYEFRVMAQAGSNKLELAEFGKRYVSRSLTLPQTVPGHATAVVIDPDTGEMSFVPARFEEKDGTTTVIMKRTGNSVYAVVSMSKTFGDVNGHWAQADIELLASKLLVKGAADHAFAPEQAVTRAEFAALLVRALGLTEQRGETAFGDVRASDWHAGAVAAASAAGLIQGYEDGSFRPNAVISREELAVLAMRAFEFAGTQPAAGKSLQQFADADAIGAWALDGVRRAISEGIMNGMTEASFAPKEQTSRAQAAVMLKRLVVKLGFMD